MPFDPMADLIDLRDVCEQVASELEQGEFSEAYRFIRAIDQDLALHSVQEPDSEILYAVSRLADDEPTVIARRYFVEYAQDLADDVGAITGEEVWPLNCIDWTFAARMLEMDYSSFYFNCSDGLIREYLIRAT